MSETSHVEDDGISVKADDSFVALADSGDEAAGSKETGTENDATADNDVDQQKDAETVENEDDDEESFQDGEKVTKQLHPCFN